MPTHEELLTLAVESILSRVYATDWYPETPGKIERTTGNRTATADTSSRRAASLTPTTPRR